MKTGIDDALREGDVSFGYEVHRVFVKRLGERVAFVTNLLETQELDFSAQEDYLCVPRLPRAVGLARAK